MEINTDLCGTIFQVCTPIARWTHPRWWRRIGFPKQAKMPIDEDWVFRLECMVSLLEVSVEKKFPKGVCQKDFILSEIRRCKSLLPMAQKDLEQVVRNLFSDGAEDILDFFDMDLVSEYQEFLIEKNIEGGFFSKKDSENILERHLVESLYSIYCLVGNELVSRETSVLDVGTGPGLPGFLFLCLKESPRVTLMDGSRRKLGLLEAWWKARPKTPHKNLQFRYERAEETKAKYDLVTMRASVPYPFSVEVVANLVKLDGKFCPFLAREMDWAETEIEILSACGFILEGVLPLEELSFVGERQIKVLKKVTPVKHGFPRDWKILSKEIKEAKWAKSSQ